jgi:hypothetical protein
MAQSIRQKIPASARLIPGAFHPDVRTFECCAGIEYSIYFDLVLILTDAVAGLQFKIEIWSQGVREARLIHNHRLATGAAARSIVEHHFQQLAL